jgi:hypothetical protein
MATMSDFEAVLDPCQVCGGPVSLECAQDARRSLFVCCTRCNSRKALCLKPDALAALNQRVASKEC